MQTLKSNAYECKHYKKINHRMQAFKNQLQNANIVIQI